jgi:hypothetical protein
MRQLLRRGSELGVEMAVLGPLDNAVSPVVNFVTHRGWIGMPHRGRLNVLANVLNKPVELILNEFQSNLEGYDEVGLCHGLSCHCHVISWVVIIFCWSSSLSCHSIVSCNVVSFCHQNADNSCHLGLWRCQIPFGHVL